jgi:hypothetical protein
MGIVRKAAAEESRFVQDQGFTSLDQAIQLIGQKLMGDCRALRVSNQILTSSQYTKDSALCVESSGYRSANSAKTIIQTTRQGKITQTS